jgi:hypothetical protein
VFALRTEKGEFGGREHYHFLMSGLPDNAINNKLCMSIMKTWEKLGGGMARVRIYESRLHGGSYILKCLGEDVYESDKFVQLDVGRSLQLSKSCYKIAASLYRRTHSRATTRKKEACF